MPKIFKEKFLKKDIIDEALKAQAKEIEKEFKSWFKNGTEDIEFAIDRIFKKYK